MSKDAVIIILDVGSTMNEKIQNSELTRLQFAKNTTNEIIRQRLLFNNKQDRLTVVLMGDDEVDEPNISTKIEMDMATLNMIKLVNEINSSVCNPSKDIFKAIDYAMDILDEKIGNKKFNKKIFLVTDGEGKNSAEKAKVYGKILDKKDIKVNVICVGFNKELEKDEEEEAGNTKESTGESTESDMQEKTKNALNALVNSTDNVKVFTDSMAQTIFQGIKRKSSNPVTKYRGPLTITPNLSFDVLIYTKTYPTNLPSLHKYSKVSEYSDSLNSNQIANERVYYLHDDPDKTPVEGENIVKAYNYGNALVPVTTMDEAMLKNTEQKCLTTIGFTDAFRVPRHFYMRGVDIIIPNPKSEDDCLSMRALIYEMINMNKVIIARYIPRAGSPPRLVVLTPKFSKKTPTFYLNYLPTVEDIRDFQFDSLKESSKEQEQYMSEFIDSLTMDQDEVEPKETYNPILQYYFKCVEDKGLNHAKTIPELNINEDESLQSLLPNENRFKNNKYVKHFPKAFPIVLNEAENEKKKRIFWKDVIKNEINNELTQEAMEAKLNDEKKPEAKKKISALKPIEDFNEMLEYKLEDLTTSAMTLMSEMIEKFIRESFKGSYFIKAIDCIKAFRDAANKEDEVSLFNKFLNDLKIKFPKDQYIDFWILLCENKITLLSKNENVKSEVSEEQANDWLEDINKKQVIASQNEDKNMEELLLDID